MADPEPVPAKSVLMAAEWGIRGNVNAAPDDSELQAEVNKNGIPG
jgi:hypothetical protein